MREKGGGIQKSALLALHTGKAAMETVFQYFQLLFCHAFQFERPFDYFGQKWDQETSKKFEDYIDRLYL